MPTDVSSLTIEVDSRDVRRGTTDLNNFSQQGRRTETATGRLQAVSHTHIRAHETLLDLVCRLPL